LIKRDRLPIPLERMADFVNYRISFFDGRLLPVLQRKVPV